VSEDGGAPWRGPGRAVSGLLQAASAAAEAAEAYIGRRLSGRADEAQQPAAGAASSSSGGSSSDATAAAAAAAAGPDEAAFGAGPASARKLTDSFAVSSVDSFTLPPIIPFGSGSASGGSPAGSVTFPTPKPLSHLGLSPLRGLAPAVVAAYDVCAAAATEQQQEEAARGALSAAAAAKSAAAPAKGSNPFAGDDGGFGSFGAGGPFGVGDGLIGTEVAEGECAQPPPLHPGFAGVSIHEISPAAGPEECAGGVHEPAAVEFEEQPRQPQRPAVSGAGSVVRAGAALGAGAAAQPEPGSAEGPGLVLRRAGSTRLRLSAPGAPEQGPAAAGAIFGATTLIGAPSCGYADEDSEPLAAHRHISEVFALSAPGLDEAPAQAQAGRVVLHAAAANAAQWYDATAAALVGAQLAGAMLPPGAAALLRLKVAFALFAAGQLLRPAGALLWPAVAARHGRAAAIGWTVALSAFPVAVVGALPTFAQVRITQGG
jgi:hypothetical protein